MDRPMPQSGLPPPPVDTAANGMDPTSRATNVPHRIEFFRERHKGMLDRYTNTISYRMPQDRHQVGMLRQQCGQPSLPKGSPSSGPPTRVAPSGGHPAPSEPKLTSSKPESSLIEESVGNTGVLTPDLAEALRQVQHQAQAQATPSSNVPPIPSGSMGDARPTPVGTDSTKPAVPVDMSHPPLTATAHNHSATPSPINQGVVQSRLRGTANSSSVAKDDDELKLDANEFISNQNLSTQKLLSNERTTPTPTPPSTGMQASPASKVTQQKVPTVATSICTSSETPYHPTAPATTSEGCVYPKPPYPSAEQIQSEEPDSLAKDLSDFDNMLNSATSIKGHPPQATQSGQHLSPMTGQMYPNSQAGDHHAHNPTYISPHTHPREQAPKGIPLHDPHQQMSPTATYSSYPYYSVQDTRRIPQPTVSQHNQAQPRPAPVQAQQPMQHVSNTQSGQYAGRRLSDVPHSQSYSLQNHQYSYQQPQGRRVVTEVPAARPQHSTDPNWLHQQQHVFQQSLSAYTSQANLHPSQHPAVAPNPNYHSLLKPGPPNVVMSSANNPVQPIYPSPQQHAHMYQQATPTSQHMETYPQQSSSQFRVAYQAGDPALSGGHVMMNSVPGQQQYYMQPQTAGGGAYSNYGNMIVQPNYPIPQAGTKRGAAVDIYADAKQMALQQQPMVVQRPSAPTVMQHHPNQYYPH